MNCKKCEAILNDNDLFCKQCGQAVNNESTNQNNNQYQTEQTRNINSYSTYNEQYQHSSFKYNTYNNKPSNNNSMITIILIIFLAVIFCILGFSLGNTMFGNNSNSSFGFQRSSYIITNNGTKINFNVETTLKEDTKISDEEQRFFDKSDIDNYLTVSVSEEYDTINDYMSAIESTANYRKKDNNYSNVQLSKIQTKIVNGKTFTYRTFDYDMETTEFRNLYIAYQIEDDSLYTVEITGYQLLTDAELNGFLDITIGG